MIGFVLVGTNDLDRGAEFYDKICAAFGAKRLYQMTTGCTGVMYGTGDGPTLGVVLPFEGKPAQAGNGVMIALAAASREDVERVHALALSLGGADEGAPDLWCDAREAKELRKSELAAFQRWQRAV
jgi:hypothetical protein